MVAAGAVPQWPLACADCSGLDLDEIMNEKVSKNEAKYPVEKARGNAAKYTEL